MHWTNQLKELISPFDIPTWMVLICTCFILSWVVKKNNRSAVILRNQSLFDVNFFMFWCILDQSNSIFERAVIRSKTSLYCCLVFVPIVWFYLSTIYKGDNVTRLTAEPPLTRFDTFKMIEGNNFTTFSRRLNLSKFRSGFYNLSKIVQLHQQYGSIAAHEALPFVSGLWYKIMLILRPSGHNNLSLNALKHEIPTQLWKYINHSSMLPDFGQGYSGNISTILNFHMKKCNKTAIILERHSALLLHTILRRMSKPSYIVKEKILEYFWGYKYSGYFPANLVLNGRYIFEAGIIAWWDQYFDFAVILKTNVHMGIFMPRTKFQSQDSDNKTGKTAVAVLTLIPGVGLLLSLFVFVFVQTLPRPQFRNKISAFVLKWYDLVVFVSRFLISLSFDHM